MKEAAEALVNKLQWLRQRTERGRSQKSLASLSNRCNYKWFAIGFGTLCHPNEAHHDRAGGALLECRQCAFRILRKNNRSRRSRVVWVTVPASGGLLAGSREKIQVFRQNIGAFAAPNKPLFIGRPQTLV